MKPEDAEEYTQALGQVVAGGYRMIAIAQRLGVPKALELSTEDWVQNRLGGYVKYSIEERKPIVRELKAEGMTQREIAAVMGVSQKTVDRDLEPESNDSASEVDNAGDETAPESNDSDVAVAATILTEPPLDLVASVAGRTGTYKPSGLSVSQSELWAFVIGDTECVLFVPSGRLRAAIERGMGKAAEETDGSCPTHGRLLSFDQIIATGLPTDGLLAGTNPVTLDEVRRWTS